MSTMPGALRRALVLALALVGAAVASAALSPATVAAAGLGDFLWERRPLLVFAPAADDPRLIETLRRVENSRCDFADRDMVLGVVVPRGASTLDDRAITADEARQLAQRFDIGPSGFAAVLIGKDGSEKFRVGDVPDMRTVYDVVDGMPMRGREAGAQSNRC